jgi:catalase
VDAGVNPHMNYEPNSQGGVRQAEHAPTPYAPWVEGHLVRQRIERTNDFKQAGERYLAFEYWERDDLVNNLVTNLQQCNRDIQERMVEHFTRAHIEYGTRVAQGLGLPVPAVEALAD